MKKFILCLLALTFCLTLFGCKDNNADLPKPNVTGDNTILGSDFQKDMNQSKAFHIDTICKNENGYFFGYADGNVYYLDKQVVLQPFYAENPNVAILIQLATQMFFRGF